MFEGRSLLPCGWALFPVMWQVTLRGLAVPSKPGANPLLRPVLGALCQLALWPTGVSALGGCALPSAAEPCTSKGVWCVSLCTAGCVEQDAARGS